MSTVGFDGSTLVLAASQGSISNEEMANVLISQGVKHALRFDGGGSTQLYSRYPGAEVDLRSWDHPERRIANGLLILIRDVPVCPPPTLYEPENGAVIDSRTITFRWSSVNCGDGYAFRVKTVPDMKSDDGIVMGADVYDTRYTFTFDSKWEGQDLYWSVTARQVTPNWAPARKLRIEPNRLPSINFQTANGISIPPPGTPMPSRDRNWTFEGTASDPEGRLREVRFRCDDCDNSGSGPDTTGGGNWSLARTGMAGKNVVYFTASDDQHTVSSRRLDLRIDLVAPETKAELRGQRPNDWFSTPVEVRLQALDQGTGQAIVGVQEIRYRLDSGPWQTRGGSSTSFIVSGDGPHTIEYYAVDKVGNQEPTHSVTFKVDTTPPTPPSGVVETHGVVSGQWQKAANTPTFTWQPSSDATSGLWGYQFYFGTDPNGVAYQTFLANQPREWTPQPGGVRTSTYYLRGRTRDNAGNYSPWGTLFTFRYDGAPPENPEEAAHTVGITNDTWQRTTNIADFSWPTPHDEGSGIKGYHVYWGTDPQGTSTDFITAAQYQGPAPLCGANEACVGYLRLRSVDNVDNQAEDWSTAFVLRYDNAPPTAEFTFNGGVTRTAQTLVTLNITASDQGSGVREMRLSNDGKNWTPWEVFAEERLWTIPAISRRSWPVYLQVRDGVGLVSEVISHTIYLDVNPQQPRSASFRLFDYAMSAGAGEHTSQPSGYQGHSTVGQVVDSAWIGSPNYTILGGYQAGSQALPIVEPGHDEFTFINGIFASGTGASTLQSALYQMIGTLGEVGLPNNETTLTSGGFQHQPGFLAAAPAIRGVPMPTPTPGPTPTPEPTPACEFPTISISQGAMFTNDTNVVLHICAPRAVEMMLSNDGGFANAQWEPYAETKPWTLTTYGQYVLPRFVYAAFKDANGAVHGVYFDDIIYDPNPPSGDVAVGDSVLTGLSMRVAREMKAEEAESFRTGRLRYVRRLHGRELAQPLALLSAQTDGTVDIFINARDDNSGLAEMQISATSAFTDAVWESYSALKPWVPTGGDGIKTVHARFRDSAGNVSTPTQAQFVLDTQPPLGGIALDHWVVGPDVITTTVYLGAEDNLSGVADLRISEDPMFSDAVWQPYTTTLVWPIFLTGQMESTLYVQYRDWAGNVSEVYSSTYVVDTTLPVMYVEVEPGDTLTRTVRIYAYDELSTVTAMRLTNDPLLIEGVVTVPYTDTVTWAFDGRRVVWVQVQDSVGNWSEPYPAYAAPTAPPATSTAWSVTLQGHGDPGDSRWAGYPVTITVFPTGGATPIITETVTLDAEGTFTLTAVIPSGTYDIQVRGQHSLSSRVEGVILPAAGAIDVGTLLEGDANGDEKVDILDFSLLAMAFNARVGDGRYNPLTDFNDDGKVDILDFSLLAMNFNRRGPVVMGGL